MWPSVALTGLLMLGCSSVARAPHARHTDAVVTLLIGRCGVTFYDPPSSLFHCGMDLTGGHLTTDDRAELSVLLERVNIDPELSPYRVRRFPNVDDDQGVFLEYRHMRWYIPATGTATLPRAVLELRDYAECYFRNQFGGQGFFLDAQGQYAVKPNCAVNPAHSRVTPLAYQSQAACRGPRAGYRER